MSSKHWAGVVTGVVIHEGFVQVAVRCAIQGSDKTVNASLPIAAEEKAAWAAEIGERIVLSLATVSSLAATPVEIPTPDDPDVE